MLGKDLRCTPPWPTRRKGVIYFCSVHLSDWSKGCKAKWFIGASPEHLCGVEGAACTVFWRQWAGNCCLLYTSDAADERK